MLLKWSISIRAHCVYFASRYAILNSKPQPSQEIRTFTQKAFSQFPLGCPLCDWRKAGCPLFEWFLGLFPTFLILISLCTQSAVSNASVLCCGQSFSVHVSCVVQPVRQLRVVPYAIEGQFAERQNNPYYCPPPAKIREEKHSRWDVFIDSESGVIGGMILFFFPFTVMGQRQFRKGGDSLLVSFCVNEQ